MAQMQHDTHLTLAQIHDSPEALLKQIMKIQKHCTASRIASSHWAQHLRFVRVPQAPQNVPDPAACTMLDSTIILQLTDKHENPRRTDYVAVSYCWESTTIPDCPGNSVRYLIQSSDGLRPSRAPSAVLYRALAYTTSRNIPFLWIDQECIEQSDPEDQELGIQAMDMVFRDSDYPLGLLTATLQDQEAMDLCAAIADYKGTDRGALFLHTQRLISKLGVQKATELLQTFVSDAWFTRTWVFQESGLTKEKMVILMPHSRRLRRHPSVGDICQEVKLTMLHMRCWPMAFVTILPQSGPHFHENPVLNYLKEQRIIGANHGTEEYLWKKMERKTAANLMSQMEGRKNSVVSDRLAILVNLCNYSRRANTTELAAAGYGLSTCFLTLAILNGDINPFCSSYHLPDALRLCASGEFWFCDPDDPSFSKNVQDFLAGWDDVHPKWNNPYGRIPRLPSVRIQTHGLETQGWIWSVNDKVPLPGLRARHRDLCLMLLDSDVSGNVPEASALEHQLNRFFWDLLHELYRRGLFAVARAVIRTLGLLSATDRSPESLTWTNADDTGRPIDTKAGSDDFQKLEEMAHAILKSWLKHGKGRLAFKFALTRDVRSKAGGLLGFVSRVLERESLWCARLNTEYEVSAVFDCEGSCTIFTTSDVDHDDLFRISAPLGLSNCFSVDVVTSQPPSSPYRLFYKGKWRSGMWNAPQSVYYAASHSAMDILGPQPGTIVGVGVDRSNQFGVPSEG